MAQLLETSGRMIRYDLSWVKGWLESRGSMLYHYRRKGMSIDDTGKQAVLMLKRGSVTEQGESFFGHAERCVLIADTLLNTNHPLPAKALASRLKISTTTIYNDMRTVEPLLAHWNVLVTSRQNQGIVAEANELTRRRAIIALLMARLNRVPRGEERIDPWNDVLVQEYTHGVELAAISDAIRKAQERLTVKMSEDVFTEFLIAILVCLRRHHLRVIKPVRLAPDVDRYLDSLEIQDAIQLLLAELLRIGVRLPFDEIPYLSLQLAVLSQINPVSDHDNKVYWEAARLVAYRAAAYLGDFIFQDAKLIKDLAHHLSWLIPRLRYTDLPPVNFLPELHSTYPHLLKVAKDSTKVLDDLVGLPLPDEAVAYVALHLGAATERAVDKLSRINVAVVCDSGMATGSFMLTKLRTRFPDVSFTGPYRKDEVRSLLDSEAVDLVVTTIPLAALPVKVLVSEPVPSVRTMQNIETCLSHIRNTILEQDVARRAGLVDVLHPGNIQLAVKASNWEEAVRAAGALLVASGAAEPVYVESAVAAVKEHGPYIVVFPGVALAHAKPGCGAKRLEVSLAVLGSPVRFGHPDNDPVYLVFAISSIDFESHSQVLSEFMEVFQQRSVVDAVAQVRSATEVLEAVSVALRKTIQERN